MRNQTTTLPAWPRYRLISDQQDSVRVEGPAVPPGPYNGRDAALAQVIRQADRLRRPIPVTAVDPDETTWSLLVGPGGEIEQTGPPTRAKRRGKPKAAGDQLSRSTSAPARVPQPRAVPQQAAAPAPEQPPVLNAIQRLANEGKLTEALHLAQQLDEALTRQHGPSHQETLAAREVRAHALVLTGALGAATVIYSDAAERWALRGAAEQAAATADRAHALWLRIEDPDEAHRVGITVLRMRNQIPGENATAYQMAHERLSELARHPSILEPRQGESSQAMPPGDYHGATRPS